MEQRLVHREGDQSGRRRQTVLAEADPEQDVEEQATDGQETGQQQVASERLPSTGFIAEQVERVEAELKRRPAPTFAHPKYTT